jgi:hypothetical protein
MESFIAFEDLRATAGHIDLVQSKLDKLHAVRGDSWAQILTAVARMYRANEVNTTQLQQFHRDMRHSYGPGFSKIWDKHIPVSSNRLHHVAARDRRVDAQRGMQSWSGTFPFGDQNVPMDTIAVVYVLFDRSNVPAYVGSSEQFKTRAKAHLRTHPDVFAYWTAYRCDDREAAYVLEVRLLRENLPYLNRKASR